MWEEVGMLGEKPHVQADDHYTAIQWITGIELGSRRREALSTAIPGLRVDILHSFFG